MPTQTKGPQLQPYITTIEDLIADLNPGRFQAVDLSLAVTLAEGESANRVQGGSANLEQDTAPASR